MGWYVHCVRNHTLLMIRGAFSQHGCVTGYYEVDTDVVRETMRVVTPPITDYKNVGYYISRECSGVPTYMLEKVVTSGE